MTDIEGRPRTRAEIRFAVSLIPCPDCGTMETAEPGVYGTFYRPVYAWACPGCGVDRSYRFHVPVDMPNVDEAPPFQLGGPQPSQLIAPEALATEVRRLTRIIVSEPQALDPSGWVAARALLQRLRICLNELAKFPGQDVTADLAWLDTVYARYDADLPRFLAWQELTHPPRPAPRGAIDRTTVRAHEAWLRAGRAGDGRLDVAHVDVHDLMFGACDLRESLFTDVLMDGANADSTTFAGAVWTRVHARDARLRSTKWDDARLDECDLRAADLDLANLRRTVITGGDWDGASLHRAILDDAVFTSVSLRNIRLVDARLDRAVFRDCDLRGADLSADLDYLKLGSNVGARFVDCDLQGTIVTGRRDLEL